MATKSEIRKVKNTLGDQLAVLERYSKLQIPNAQIGIVEICHAENAVRIISGVLHFLRDYVVDENDYQYGCDLELEVRNTFDLFLEKAHGEKERLNGTIPGEMYLNDISETMVDLIDWLDEYDEQHQEALPVEQTPQPETKEARSKKNNISPKVNSEELKRYFTAKFKGAGANIDYFSTMVSDIEGLSTIKDCMAVALMIYNNENYFIAVFNTFSDWCKRFFECIGIEVQEGFNFSRKYEPAENIKKVFAYLM